MHGQTPRIENAPYHSLTHRGLTIEGWSRAGIASYWRVPELRLGFDLGGIPWDFTHTTDWFVSHAHIDHLCALPALVARRAMLKYPPPRIHVPAEIVEEVRGLLRAWEALDRATLSAACTLIGMEPGQQVSINENYSVSAFRTAHPVPSRGYVVWEHREKLRPEFAGLPGPELKGLRERGETVTAPVAVPRLCYTGDTGPEGLESEPALYEAEILIIEMSFARPEHAREKIHAFGHLHLEDFRERAERFRNEVIVAMHVTSRDEPASFAKWVQDRLPADLARRMLVWGS